ncbi:hypothetical protein [Roseovarius nanhaiticus]|uniref:hypothetical protein n=1 Tax=Roseovarius nanhaiticus TaxID=573024 RepID=UPI0024914F55|nr:hypothetical protein [Roseovarius nanhaiticus]
MNYFAIGFGAVALTAVVAIDYANQANIAGAAPGSYPASAYMQSFAARWSDACDAQSDATAAAAAYLPPAPEGWTRTAWPTEDAPLRGWIYRQGDTAVALWADYQAAGSDCGASGGIMAGLAQAAKVAGTGWAVIGGTAYRHLPAGSHAKEATSAGLDAGYDAAQTTIGFDDMVTLTALSTAPESALRSLLAAADYDGLNGLLSTPLPLMGSDAPIIATANEAKAADVLLALQAGVLLANGGADLDAVRAARIGVLKAGSAGRAQIALEGAVRHGAANVDALNDRDVTSTDEPTAAPEPRSKPQRLTLSGGKSCLEGSASRFCRD